MSQESEKKKALELAVQQIEKRFGEGAIMTLGKYSSSRTVSVIPTGAITLDIALGIGGIPRGRIVEIFGPESSGKSTLAMHIVANAQKNGGLAAYIDAEHALDPQHAARIGVRLDELMLSQPDSGEEALNIVEALVLSDALSVVVVDSVAALVPKNELAGEVGDSFMGMQARMMSQALRKLASSLARSNTCAIFINQIREKIGVMFGNPETTTGGRALKFYASIRIDIRKIGSLKAVDGGEVGTRVKAKVVKNKMAPPFQTAEFDLLFNEGISRESALIDVGVDLGIIEKRGTWFSYGGTRLGQGREAARDELKKNKQLTEEIEKAIHAKRAGKSAPQQTGAQDKEEELVSV